MASPVVGYCLILDLLLCIVQSNANWNTKDYLKREHSLIKPYQGNLILLFGMVFKRVVTRSFSIVHLEFVV